MASVYSNPTLDRSRQQTSGGGKPAKEGYTKRLEPDTNVPPKLAAIVADVSVNGVLIAESEILAEAQNHPADTPGDALRQAARALAVRQLLLHEAARKGITAGREHQAGEKPEAEDDAVIRLLIDREVQVPRADEAECRRYYDANPGKVLSPSLSEARHILLAVKQGDKPARKAALDKAYQLQQKIAEAPHEFAALAQLHSDCPSSQQGGNLGQLSAGSTVPEFETALARLSPRDSKPGVIESRFGVHVVMLERRIDGETLAFEIVQERIAAWLEAAAWSKAVSQYIAILAGAADIRGIDLEGAEGVLVQ